jgi:DGQHR domain-containing protein
LQLERIRDIREYIESNEANFLPNSVILSANLKDMRDFEENYLKYQEEGVGYLNFPDDTVFTIIDGQHRLAGLITADENITKNIDMVTILLINTDISVAAKLFADINGKQKPVNRSLIYDLYETIPKNELNEIKKFHIVCEKFYSDKESPLYKQIKMLGIGDGAISQAFFIDSVANAIKKTDLKDKTIQEIYTQLFCYFKAFQNTFSDDWPVPVSSKQVDAYEYARNVLTIRKSQLVKTNGFGAIMKAFPRVYPKTMGEIRGYYTLISKLKGKISWVRDPNAPMGTGKAYQDQLVKQIESILFD